MPRTVLTSGLVFALGLVQLGAAQEPNGKPDAPTPKTTQLVPALPKKSVATALEHRVPEPQTVADLPTLAASVAEYISTIAPSCQPKLRALLVTNFTLPSGDTSAYGIQLADELSHELANKEYKVRVIDRQLLQNVLGKGRIPTQAMNHAVVRSIAEALDARFVVLGTTERLDSGQMMLSSQVIDTTVGEWSGPSMIVYLGRPESDRSIKAVEPFPPLPEITSSSTGEAIYKAGLDGTGLPECRYMPAPAYSEAARKLKLNGPVTAEAVITADGRLEDVRIVRGLPGGLNEQTIAALKTWRCQPALKDGKPVATLVPFTVNFRSY